jgi:Cys-tRNA(Pro)/Cys-tRNA(Cys) deacylase
MMPPKQSAAHAVTASDGIEWLMWVDREVSLKKLALAFQGKTAKMMRPADVERLTGYRIGGISPFAQKKRVPIAIEEAALSESTVFLNGGQRGLQIELEPNDARKALDAIVRPLTA